MNFNFTISDPIKLALCIGVLIIFFALIGILSYVFSRKENAKRQLATNNEIIEEPQTKSIVPLLLIILYVSIFFIIAAIIQTILVSAYVAINNIDPNQLIEGTEFFVKEVYDEMINTLNPIIQVIVYGLCFVALIPLGYKSIIKDLKKFNINKDSLCVVFTFIAIYAANIIGSIILIFCFVSGNSSNQEALDSIFNSGTFGLVSTMIITVIAAPIIEELVFRKAIFDLCGKKEILAVVLSALLFGGLHIISPTINEITLLLEHQSSILNIVTEIVYIIPYALMGFALSISYKLNDKNIFTSILIHAIYNLSTFLMLFAY